MLIKKVKFNFEILIGKHLKGDVNATDRHIIESIRYIIISILITFIWKRVFNHELNLKNRIAEFN